MYKINLSLVNEGRVVPIPRVSSGATSREDFIDTWLTEMPMGLGAFSTYDGLCQDIHNLINSGVKVSDMGNNLRSYVGNQVAYFWYVNPQSEEPILITQLDIKPQALVVSMTGKSPNYKGKPPYASDLYNMILDSTGRSIRLMSDETLSDEGYDIWKRLLSQGNKVSIYDKEHPGQTMITVDTVDDMEKYFKTGDSSFKRYQYVISESGEGLAETKSHFNTRRMRELVPGLLK